MQMHLEYYQHLQQSTRQHKARLLKKAHVHHCHQGAQKNHTGVLLYGADAPDTYLILKAAAPKPCISCKLLQISSFASDITTALQLEAKSLVVLYNASLLRNIYSVQKLSDVLFLDMARHVNECC